MRFVPYQDDKENRGPKVESNDQLRQHEAVPGDMEDEGGEKRAICTVESYDASYEFRFL